MVHKIFTESRERQFARLRRNWGIKKNTRKGEREKLLKTLEESEISVEGKIGTVSLNIEKIKRWRKEIKSTTGQEGILDVLSDNIYQHIIRLIG